MRILGALQFSRRLNQLFRDRPEEGGASMFAPCYELDPTSNMHRISQVMFVVNKIIRKLVDYVTLDTAVKYRTLK